MAAPSKSTKPMTKEELRQPDEVEVKLSAFWQGIYDHRKLIFGGAAVLLVGGVAMWFSYEEIGSMMMAATSFLASRLAFTIFLISSRQRSSSARFSCSN